MVTNDERREVARRLRGVNPYRNQSYMVPCYRYTPAVEYLSELAGALGYSPKNDVSRLGFQNRLADLIDPDEPKVKCVAEVKVDGEQLEKLAHDAVAELAGIDRDELTAQVKELEKCAWYFGLDFDEDEPMRDRLKEASEDFAECARRIRKALGVSDG